MSKQGNNRTTDTTTETAANTAIKPKEKPITRQSGSIVTPKKRRGQTKLSPAHTAFSKAARAFSAMQREIPALTSPAKKPKVDSTLTDKDKLRSPSPAPRDNKSPTSTVSHKTEETSDHDSQEEEPTPSPMDDFVNAVVNKLNTLRDVQPPPGGPSTGDDAGQKKTSLDTVQDISDREPIRHYIKEAKLPLHLMLSASDGLNILRVIRYLHAIHRAKIPASPSSSDSQKIDMLLEGSSLANDLHPHLPPTSHVWYDYVNAIVKQRCTLLKGNVTKTVQQALKARARINVVTHDQFTAHKQDVMSFIEAYKWFRTDVLQKALEDSDLQDMEIDMAVMSLPRDMEVAARTMINQNPEPPHTWNCIMTLVQTGLTVTEASDYNHTDRPTQKYPSSRDFGAAAQSRPAERDRPLRPYSAPATPPRPNRGHDGYYARQRDEYDGDYGHQGQATHQARRLIASRDYRPEERRNTQPRQQRADGAYRSVAPPDSRASSQQSRRDSGPYCMRCKGYFNHSRTDCPNFKGCFNCGSKEHKAADCQNKKNARGSSGR